MDPKVLAARLKPLKKSFHVMAKPIGSLCNFNCTYCYYLPKANLLSDTTKRMSDELLERYIRLYISSQEVPTVTFIWHGGEPTLLGIDFFQKVVDLQQKYAGSKNIENDIQTNGFLVDSSWCDFFKKNRFRIGLSIDGSKHLHNTFRRLEDGGPTFEPVFRAADLLRRYGLFFGALTVIHSANVQHPDEVYRFLTQELGARFVQWLPCIEIKDYCTTSPEGMDVDEMPLLGSEAAKPGHPDSIVTDWSVDPDDWGEFLIRTFDLWSQNDIGKVFVNWYESLAVQWLGQPAAMCVLADVCGRSMLVVEKDGSIYPCDHFVYPEYKLGNLMDEDCDLAKLAYGNAQRKFGCKKRDSLTTYCKQCKYRFACNGGCPRYRLLKTPDGEPGLNYLCSGFRKFLTHADPYFRRIAQELQKSIQM